VCLKRWSTRLAAATAAVVIAASPASAREKIDLVVLDNGDELTCEIKELNRGILKVGTSYFVGSVSIEWVHVERISSTQFFEVELEDGTRHFGAIASDRDEEALMVITGLGPRPVDHDHLVRISQLEEGFRDRLKGSLDLGLNAFKAHDEAIFTLRSTNSYRTRKRRISADLSANLSTRDDAEEQRQASFNLQYSRILGPRWYWFARPSWERNDELDLDRRTSIAGGIGRSMVQTNNSLLVASVGLSANREEYAEMVVPEIPTSESSSTGQSNLEGLISLKWEVFTFGSRETDLSVALDVLPSLTDTGRVRTKLLSSIRHELFSDFYIAISFDTTYDNRPPTDAEKSDWNLVSSIGYSY
jgi:putative salt-induced outer membrane protein YdiY